MNAVSATSSGEGGPPDEAAERHQLYGSEGNPNAPDGKGVIVKPKKPSHDAFEWYVLNDSGGLENAANWPLWDAWRHTPGNKAKYIEALDFIQLIRKLPPPLECSGEELAEDFAREGDGGSEPH